MRAIDDLRIDGFAPLEEHLIVDVDVGTAAKDQIVAATIVQAHDLVLLVVDSAAHYVVDLVGLISVAAAFLLVYVVHVEHAE